MQWVLGSVLVLSLVLMGGRFPVLVLVADGFPFLISSSEFFLSKLNTHEPGTQVLEPTNTNYFFIHKEHPMTRVKFHISIVLTVFSTPLLISDVFLFKKFNRGLLVL
jgi:hypothetical protein